MSALTSRCRLHFVVLLRIFFLFFRVHVVSLSSLIARTVLIHIALLWQCIAICCALFFSFFIFLSGSTCTKGWTAWHSPSLMYPHHSTPIHLNLSSTCQSLSPVRVVALHPFGICCSVDFVIVSLLLWCRSFLNLQQIRRLCFAIFVNPCRCIV